MNSIYRIGIVGTSTTDPENKYDFVKYATINDTRPWLTLGATNLYHTGSSLAYPDTVHSSSREYMSPGMLVSEVPIPAAFWLLGSCLIGIAGIKKRFKKQRIEQHKVISKAGSLHPAF